LTDVQVVILADCSAGGYSFKRGHVVEASAALVTALARTPAARTLRRAR
jgi:hypothetical protein